MRASRVSVGPVLFFISGYDANGVEVYFSHARSLSAAYRTRDYLSREVGIAMVVVEEVSGADGGAS